MRILATSILALSTVVSAEAKVERPPQFVALAFDGSRNINFWKESRAFARETGVRFTYFISGVYFLTRNDRNKYREPRRGRGRSAIGFGGKTPDIAQRVEQVALAISEGHEIASHANGHYNGARYSKSQWELEIDQFENIMALSWERYSDLPEPNWWKGYFRNEVKGLRAPQLGRGPGLFRALKSRGYTYDTSRTARPGYWPRKIDGVWNFPLANLRIAGSRRGTLSMDYNFYVADSGGRRGSKSRFGRYEERMFQTYMNYFNHNYSGRGNRAPVDIGHHFSAWNGAAYWRAMKRFTRAVCFRPEVICGTYEELQKFIEENRANIADYRRGNFDRSSKPSKLVMAYAKPPAKPWTYKRQKPVAVASLSETLGTAESSVQAPSVGSGSSEKPAVAAAADSKASKDELVVLDSGLRRPNLAAMTPAEVKAYWTLVWYANQGKKMPEEEAKALGITVEYRSGDRKLVLNKPATPEKAPEKVAMLAKPLANKQAKTVAKQKLPSLPKAKKTEPRKASDAKKIESKALPPLKAPKKQKTAALQQTKQVMPQPEPAPKAPKKPKKVVALQQPKQVRQKAAPAAKKIEPKPVQAVKAPAKPKKVAIQQPKQVKPKAKPAAKKIEPKPAEAAKAPAKPKKIAIQQPKQVKPKAKPAAKKIEPKPAEAVKAPAKPKKVAIQQSKQVKPKAKPAAKKIEPKPVEAVKAPAKPKKVAIQQPKQVKPKAKPVAKKIQPKPVQAAKAPAKPEKIALLKPKQVKPEVKSKTRKQAKAKFDAGLRRPDFTTMSPGEVKAYWTKVWYARRAQRLAKRNKRGG